MSALFRFRLGLPHSSERNRLIAERFCELASHTHTAASTNDRDGDLLVRLRRNGERRLDPHEDGYRFALGIAFDHESGEAMLSTTEGADAESILHPLVDILVDFLLHDFQVTWFDFGECTHGDLEVPTIPCSGRTLERLLSSESVSAIIWGRVRIGEDLIRAFAIPECKGNKNLSLAFRCSNIVNYSLLGQTLRNIFLRQLTIEPKRGHNVVPLLQGLTPHPHPKLKILFLSEVCGPSLTQLQSHAMWTAISGIKLVELKVEQANNDAMHGYTFDGLWNMLAQHESIRDIYLYHHSPMWTEQHVDAVKKTLRANPRIVRIDGIHYWLRNMCGKWNREIEPLLRMNRLQIRIDQIMSQPDPSLRQAEWLELLIANSGSLVDLYQVLRETVDLWACSLPLDE